MPHTAHQTEGRSRVDLFEYQARDIFEKHGVPVLGGVVATTPEEAAREPRSSAGAPWSSRPR